LAIAVLGGARFTAQYGEADSSGRSGLFTAPIPAEFDTEQEVGSFAVGWFEKPILRDGLVALGLRDTYEGSHRLLKKALLDAVSLDLKWGMSRKFDLDELSESTDKFTFSEDFTVTVQYKLPLDGLLQGGGYKSP
jgi:hypothetical protein